MSANESSRATYPDDEAKWRAVVQKDRTADGKFFFAVRTTGVYCRPSCPARHAHRKNVTFYESAADAERAGFRACMRCHPTEPTLGDRHAAAVTAACRAIETAEELPNLAALASSAGLSRYHFHRIFKTATGLSPKVYAAAHRSERMRKELPKHRTVTEAIYEAGFKSNGRFYAGSPGMLGMKPKDYRARGRGATIRFAVGECSLGSILVAASDSGVCAIFLGDDPNLLVKNLQDRFSKATIIGGDKGFEKLVAKVVGFIEAPGTDLALPLDAGDRLPTASLASTPGHTCREYVPLFRDRQAHRFAKICSWSPGLVLPIRWPWRFLATASCAETEISLAIVGASNGNWPCWKRKAAPRRSHGVYQRSRDQWCFLESRRWFGARTIVMNFVVVSPVAPTALIASVVPTRRSSWLLQSVVPVAVKSLSRAPRTRIWSMPPPPDAVPRMTTVSSFVTINLRVGHSFRC
jgi:AraC family transcriptional regulator of adaptative response/methylated-DNA-[protein]-cysteine methyltransferase